MGKLTPAEITKLVDQANQAWESGDWETGLALSKKLPMPEEIKQAAIGVVGEDYLIAKGFNLNSEQSNEWYNDKSDN